MNESPHLVWLLSTPACRGDPGGFGLIFFLFLILCSCDKARLLPKERYFTMPIDSNMCFKHSMQKHMARDRKKSNLSKSSPLCGWIWTWLE